MPSLTDKYGVSDLIPEGQMGPWKVEHFTVDRERADKDKTKAAIGSFTSGGRWTPPGRYVGLFRGRNVVMSDVPDEVRDHLTVIREARGEVLIHGLGLGMVAAAALRKENVTHVTVVEKAPEVIELVGQPLAQALGGDPADPAIPEKTPPFWFADGAPIQTERLAIVQGDALTWKPPVGSMWDVVWHDIWDTLCTDNLEEMKRLHRRFGNRTIWWQGSWSRERLEAQLRRERRAMWR